MARRVEDLHQEILSLKAEEREALLRTLIADLDGETEEDIERAWLDEAHRRRKELKEDVVEAIPAKEVFAQARARLKR